MFDFLHSPYQHTVAPNCPHYQFAELVGGPNIKWCEQTICSYFNEPNLTWTNIPYILLAVYFILHCQAQNRNEFKYFSWSIFITGLFSLIYHATNNWITQYLDFFGMFLMLSAIIGLNLSRATFIKTRFAAWSFYASFVFLCTILFFLSPDINFPVQMIVVIGVAVILITEIFATKNSNAKVSHGNFIISLAFFAVAITFSILDHKRILCDPNNHWIQGHGIWHILAAVAFYFTYQHYLNIERKYFILR